MLNEYLFRLINGTLNTPVFDVLMPVFSDKDHVVIPGAVLVGIVIFFGGKRTRLCLLALIPALLLSDGVSAQVLKSFFEVPRPYMQLADVHLFRGDHWTVSQPGMHQDGGPNYGFPSSHAANAAAVAVVLAVLNRKTLWATVPLTLLIGLSRIYTGHHFPLDVLGGFVWGAASGGVSAGLMLRFAGPRVADGRRHARWADIHPARQTFYVFLAAWTLFNFVFIHLQLFDLAGDEAQYWDWSRQLALGYYSKPPLIAYVIAILTSAGGNQEWAIRSGAVIFSSLTVALIYALTLRVTKRERTALLAAVIAMAMPVIWVGSVLMTVDPLLCFLWAAALYAFHRAVNGEARFWWIVGLACGFGLLTKYTMVLLLFAFAFYLIAIDRTHWRTRGPYLAVMLTLACISGVLYWNWRHDWISFRHTANIGASKSFNPLDSLRNVAEYAGSQLGVVSPILLLFMLWAVSRCIAHFRRNRDAALLALVFVSVFGVYAVISVTYSPEPNWPACAYIAGAPALAWMWRSRDRRLGLRRMLVAGVALGLVMGVAVRSTGLLYLVARLSANPHSKRVQLGPMSIDPDKDPTNALLGGHEIGAALSSYMKNDSQEAPFPFSDRYQLTAWSAFYTEGRPRAYCMSIGDRRLNQYDLWGGWDELTGRDGLFVTGGGSLKAVAFVGYMVENGYFETGEVVETIEVRRGGIVIKQFFLAHMRSYTGKPWPLDGTKF